MNLILLFEKDFLDKDKNFVCLNGRRFEYIQQIHKAHKGDTLTVGLLNDKIGRGRIVELMKDSLQMQVDLQAAPPSPLKIQLILALPRPNVVKRVLIAATSLGIKKIVFYHCRRVEKSFWNSPALTPEKIFESVCLGLEQAKDTLLPEVILKKRFKPFVEDDLPALINGSKAFLAHPGSENPSPSRVSGPATLIIGPEGGFIPYEIQKLTDLGCLPINLGQRILRVETAVTYLIAKMA